MKVRRKLASQAITRFEEARKLERILGLPMGSVIIYCPRVESGLEGLSTLVEWEGQIRELRDIPDCDVKEEITGLIQNVTALRQICVFLDQEIAQDSDVVTDLAQQSLILLRSLRV